MGVLTKCGSRVGGLCVVVALGGLVACGGAPIAPDEVEMSEVRVSSQQSQWTDASGLRVVFEERRSSPVVALQLWVGVGSADERPHEAGLAHVHEHMIFKGTERRGVGEIARAVEAVGGNINAWTSFDETVYHLTVPSRHFGEGADILLDAACKSAFDAEELERELEVIQEEIRRGEDMPSRVLSQALFSEVFRNHPYGLPIIGTSESVASFGRDDVLAFFQRWYAPENMTLVVVGDVSRADVEAALGASLRCRPSEAFERPARVQEPVQSDGLRLRVLQKDVQEAHLALAWRGPELAHEDTVALDVLMTLLGGSESSLLFDRVQRQRGLTRSVYSYLYSPMEPGLLLVGARSRLPTEAPERLVEILEALVEEVARVRHAPVSRDALERARRMLESDVVFSAETAQGRARRLGHFTVVAGGLAYEARAMEALRQLTVDDVQRVARAWLDPRYLTVGVLVPESLDVSSLTRDALDERFQARDRAVAAQAVEPRGERVAERVVEATLANGLRVYVEEDPSVPLVTARLLMPGGLPTEPRSALGVSHLMAELLTSGTRARSAQQLAASLDAMAASIGGFAGSHAIGLQLSAMSRDLDAALALMAECLLESTFPAEEFERLQRETLDHLAAIADQPAREAMRLFQRTLYGEHPYGFDVVGLPETVERLRREDVIAHHAAMVRPQNAVLSIVGDVDAEALLERVESLFGGWEASDTPWQEPDAPVEITSPVRVESLRERQQAHVVLGWQTPGRASADEATFQMMGAILSGQGGRLFLELRDRQSLAYTVSAFWSPAVGAGAFLFYIGTSPDKVETALDGMRAEVERLRTSLVSSEELERARTYLVGNRDIGLQSQGTRAAYRAFDAAFGPAWDHADGFEERLREVTPEAIREAAEAWFRPEAEVLSVVRPARGEDPAPEAAE